MIFHNCRSCVFTENGLTVYSDVPVMNIIETIIMMQTGKF